MQIAEPMTTATDYLLGSLTLFLARKLWQAGGQIRVMKFWSVAFYASTLAAVAGGTAHGFALYLTDAMHGVLWKITVYAIGGASFCMLAATILATTTRPVQTWLLRLAVLKFIVYAVWMLWHNAFKYVIYDYVPAMLGVLILAGYAWMRHRSKGGVWIAGGIVLSFWGAGMQQSGFALHAYFNHNDLYHLIQMTAMIALYKGARSLVV